LKKTDIKAILYGKRKFLAEEILVIYFSIKLGVKIKTARNGVSFYLL